MIGPQDSVTGYHCGSPRMIRRTAIAVSLALLAAPVAAGVIWMIEHPNRGLVEPEDLDDEHIMKFCRPYLGPVVAERSDWTPLKGRSVLFEEAGLDLDDPWQFQNFRVS